MIFEEFQLFKILEVKIREGIDEIVEVHEMRSQ